MTEIIRFMALHVHHITGDKQSTNFIANQPTTDQRVTQMAEMLSM